MRCAVYIRVSTDKEEQKTSLENQKSLFYQFIEDKGWDVYNSMLTLRAVRLRNVLICND
ncbi:recombinase family protein [Aneurinibacillus aneurinilyticus]|uniref:recombinase family protein n=1 Tax=Aneurinibacillus aneurinilyticus TaxID=1391 RepID=UPI0021CC4AF8|nr:recombinase family protein [Aneurinibacillus aneurinilyticus]MED0708508.1 recombinase family protein [Aneurinibacillus aneurinilyticus]MED0723172.1 recombinase family protein [Aneurinibacillus aneurinilyticus]MED0733005.1 recombinase family protein [Aneurinibacillus aneurinilyticus]MED0739556.1 recombinase family protein [Aneurinibacillus aneurinilyticus]